MKSTSRLGSATMFGAAGCMLGILLGGVVGWLLRIWLAPCQETDCFLVAVWALLGAVAGGVVGAITGAALGSRRGAARADPTDTQE